MRRVQITHPPTSAVAAASVAGLVAVVAFSTAGATGLGLWLLGIGTAAVWTKRAAIFPGDEFDDERLFTEPWCEPRRLSECRRWTDQEATADGLRAIHDDITTGDGDRAARPSPLPPHYYEGERSDG